MPKHKLKPTLFVLVQTIMVLSSLANTNNSYGDGLPNLTSPDPSPEPSSPDPPHEPSPEPHPSPEPAHEPSPNPSPEPCPEPCPNPS